MKRWKMYLHTKGISINKGIPIPRLGTQHCEVCGIPTKIWLTIGRKATTICGPDCFGVFIYDISGIRVEDRTN